MRNRRIISELKRLIRLRGKVTKLQREYAQVEEKAISQMHAMTKPSDEKRYSNLRTLKSYIGEDTSKKIIIGQE